MTPSMFPLSERRSMHLAWGLLLLVTVVAGLSAWIYVRLTAIVEERVGSSLQVTLDAAIEGVHAFAEDAQRAALAAVQDAQVTALVSACAEGGGCDGVHGVLAPYLHAGGFGGFDVIVGGRERVVAGPRAGGSARIDEPQHAQLARLPELRPKLLPPVRDGEVVAMHAAVALSPARGQTQVVLRLVLPLDDLQRLLHAARAGRSGETYAFDAQARMLSESRFGAQLHAMGLLPPGAASTVLTLELCDPGAVRVPVAQGKRPPVDRPRTQMVQRALDDGRGLSLAPYRDYRGEPVVGAAHFLPELGIGVVTELDAYEVFGTLRELKRLFAWLCAALAVCSSALLAAVAYAAHLRKQLARQRAITTELAGDMGIKAGVDLEQLMAAAQGPLPPGRAVALIEQLCDVLEQAHTLGIAHGALTPRHVRVRFDAQRGEVVEVLSAEAPLTRPPTPHAELFVAPELQRGGAPTVASDLYAVGALLRYALDGELSPRPAQPMQVDSPLQWVLHTCLSPRPEARPQSAAALRELLGRTPASGSWTLQDARMAWEST